MEIAIGVIIGLAAGLAMYLIGRREIAPLRSEASDLRRELDAVRPTIQEHELNRATAETQLTERNERLTTLQSELEESNRRASRLADERADLQSQLAERAAQASAFQEQVATLTQERDESRQQLSQREESLTTARERVSESDEAIENLKTGTKTLTEERDAARREKDELRRELSATQVRLRGIEADHTARQEELEAYRGELETRFQGIATTVTESTREQFIKEFRDLTKQQSESSAELVGNTVKPLRESLEKLDKGTQAMEKAREHAYADLRRSLLQSNEAIDKLSNEASGLRQALRSPQVRGLWGEQQLQNVLEASGLREHVDFGQQFTSGSARPDVVVQIPGERSVVIDAKTPLDSYLNALEASDEKAERDLLTAHANSLFNHARSLGQKDYSQQIDDALDFVILFVPSDAILDAALRVRPGLFEDSWNQHRVLMATPGSLIAFLRAVAQVWQQQSIQENANEIAASARELYDRLSTYTNHVDRMGRSLGQTVEHYNRSVGSFQSRVLSSARKIEDLSDIEATRRIDDLSPLEQDVRQITAPELALHKSGTTDVAGVVSSEGKEASGQAASSELSADRVNMAVNEEGFQESTSAATRETMDAAIRRGESIPSQPTTARTTHRVMKRTRDRRIEAVAPPSHTKSPATTPPLEFGLWGESHIVHSWRDVIAGVAEAVYEQHGNDFRRLLEWRGERGRRFVSENPNDLIAPRRVADSSFWMYTNFSAAECERRARELLELFGHSGRDLQLFFAPVT